ncbi:MAG: hypothetical protein WD512_15985, partial [Candidatus Paceibacterota bacterium]
MHLFSQKANILLKCLSSTKSCQNRGIRRTTTFSSSKRHRQSLLYMFYRSSFYDNQILFITNLSGPT